ncbi:MAG: palindromic element RPE1 domain-containing protein [Holosporales bacterium]|jgi:RPE1 domain-containing protein|nr:palindromic element RPE1 domain-containing protein [Holosporales bacterium]
MLRKRDEAVFLIPHNIGPLSKPSKSEFWEGDTEHRSGAYLDVREHSSTGSTYPKTDFEDFERGPFKNSMRMSSFALC